MNRLRKVTVKAAKKILDERRKLAASGVRVKIPEPTAEQIEKLININKLYIEACQKYNRTKAKKSFAEGKTQLVYRLNKRKK